MKLEELEKKYEELGAEIEKLKAEQDEEWPKVGDEYYCTTSDGEVFKSQYESGPVDFDRLASGNCHRTEEAAEAYRAWLTDPRTQARRMVEMCEGFDVKGPWDIYHNSATIEIIFTGDNYFGGVAMFKSEPQAQSAIDKLGEDLIKVALGVITGDEAREIVMRAMRGG